MTQAKVTMTTRSIGEGATVVDISGEVSAEAENALMDAYTQASSAGGNAIILNFASLEYMNSSGIGLLVTVLIRANRQGQRLMAVGLNEHYQRIFELTRLNEAIHIFPTEDDALASMSGAS